MKKLAIYGALILTATTIGIVSWAVLIFGWNNYPITTLISLIGLIIFILYKGIRSFFDFT